MPHFTLQPYDDMAALDAITDRTCGVSVASEEFLVALADRCREKEAALIYDEVQSGLMRSGHLWAHAVLPQSAHPDILIFAKAIGNGLPFGGVLVTSDILYTLQVGDTSSTLGGNPLACRVGCHVLERLTEPSLIAGVRAKSRLFFGRLADIQKKHPDKIAAIKGRGLFIGIEMVKDPTPFVDAARVRGLLCVGSGLNTIRFLPPLNIDDEDVKTGLDIFESVVAAVPL